MTDREYKVLLKKNHFCLDCRKQDAYTFAGRTYCYECSEKRRANARAYRATNHERLAEARRKRYMDRKANRECVVCGRALRTLEMGVMCAGCEARNNNRTKKAYNPKRAWNMCCQCTKMPPLAGKKLCAECYDKNMTKLEKAWRARKEKEATK